jgi:hypothetical protein
MEIPIPTIEIGTDGNIRTLYTDEIELYDLGIVCNVRRASTVEFNEDRQEWEVRKADNGRVVHRNKNREAAIAWEIKAFSPGGVLNRRTRAGVK